MEVIWDILKNLEGKEAPKLISFEEAESKLKGEGMSEMRIEESIAKLKKRGDIFEPKPGWLQFI